MPTPAVLYASKSTPDEKGSNETQLEECRSRALELGRDIAAEFHEDDKSGWKGNRGPELEAALKEAADLADRQGEAELWVWKSERLARGSGRKEEARSLLEVFTHCRRAGVTLRSVHDDAYVQDEAMVGMASKMAEKYSADLSIAVKAGMRRRATEKGKPGGGPRPLGLDFSDDGYIPRQTEVPTVQRIFAELKGGKAQIQLARDLEAEKMPTANGGRWHQGTIARIARNPAYKGCIRHNGEVLEGTHEPIVDPKLWEEVNELLDRKAKSTPGKGRGRPPKGRHLFRKGLLRCENGGCLVPQTRPNRTPGSLNEIYYCYDHKLGRCDCGLSVLKRAPIDTAVYNYFAQVALDVEATKEQLAESRDRKLAEVRALHSQATAEKLRVEDQRARVRRDYLEGKIEAEHWKAFSDELTADLESAEAQVSRLSEQLEEVEAWNSLRDIEHEALASIAEIRKAIAGEIKDAAGADAVRAALVKLFDGFMVKRVQPGMRVHAELAWQGDYVIEPIVAEHAVEGYSPLRPILRREPLYDTEAINRWASPSSTASCGPASAPSCAVAPIPRRDRAGSGTWSSTHPGGGSPSTAGRSRSRRKSSACCASSPPTRPASSRRRSCLQPSGPTAAHPRPEPSIHTPPVCAANSTRRAVAS